MKIINVTLKNSERIRAIQKYYEHPKLKDKSLMPNPVLEELMDEVIMSRRIPIEKGIDTLTAIRDKYEHLKDYINDCIRVLMTYRNKI